MAISVSPKRHYATGLSFSEERALREKEQYLDSVYKKKEIAQGVTHDPKDLNRIRTKLEGVRDQLRFAPERAEGHERVKIEAEIKRVEDEMAKFWGGTFPTWEEHWINPKSGGIRYNVYRDRIVQVNKSKEYADLFRRWQFLRRRLEPQDPNIASSLHLYRNSK